MASRGIQPPSPPKSVTGSVIIVWHIHVDHAYKVCLLLNKKTNIARELVNNYC